MVELNWDSKMVGVSFESLRTKSRVFARAAG